MKSTAPMGKLEMMEASFRCFRLGLWSLMPIIGIPIIFRTLTLNLRVETGSGTMWNPASGYLFWGAMLARLALMLNLVIVTTVICFAIGG